MRHPKNPQMPDGGAPQRVPVSIALASFTSSVDRFAVSPLLVFLAVDLGASLDEAVAVAGVYFLAYGFTQPLWGGLSDRFGRMRMMRIALAGSVVFGLLSAIAPTLPLLMVFRSLTGACFGGIIPTAITFIGDTVPPLRRQAALADNMAAIAVGTAIATAAAGVVGETVGWRLMFALPPVLAVGCIAALWTTAEPPLPARRPLLGAFAEALRHRWMLAVIGLVFVEGAVVLGLLTLLAPALQDQGLDASVAGLAVAAYGVSTLACSRLVRPILRRLSVPATMALGGAGMVAGYAAVAVHVSVPTVAFAAAALGWTWALLHTSLQVWATDVLPGLRGTAVALFAASLFAGSSVGTLVAGPLADAGQWAWLFSATAAVAAVLVGLVVVAQRRYLAAGRP